MIKFVKECVWAHKNRRSPKSIVDYRKGDVMSDISVDVEEQMVDAGYAVYSDAEGKPMKAGQIVEVETKDLQTKPVRKAVKATDDHKSN